MRLPALSRLVPFSARNYITRKYICSTHTQRYHNMHVTQSPDQIVETKVQERQSSRKRSSLAGPNYGNWVRHYSPAVIPPCRGGPLAIHERSLGTFSDSANILVCGLHNVATTPRPPGRHAPRRRPSLTRIACNKRNGAGSPSRELRPDQIRAMPRTLIHLPVGPHTARVRARISLSPSLTSVHSGSRSPWPVNQPMGRRGGRRERNRSEALGVRVLQLESMIYNEDQDCQIARSVMLREFT